MPKHNKILSFAKKKINKNLNKINTLAVIESSGRIISSAQNDMSKSHTVFFNGHHCKAIHAEFAAIRKTANPEGTNIYIFRFLKNGGLGNSKPCSNCMRLIIENKIRTITYYDGKQIVTTKPKIENVRPT